MKKSKKTPNVRRSYAARGIGCLIMALACWCMACNKWIDVVPEGISELGNAFSLRSEAKKYLYTCYSYMPAHGNPEGDPSITGGDELFHVFDYGWTWVSNAGGYLSRGQQHAGNVLFNDWGGMYRGIRDCNIFLENVASVPDLRQTERDRWIAEANFLKAYYHFWLLRKYGPIPLIRENLPISAGVEEVRVWREPVDTCANYIIRLIERAIPSLPLFITNETEELGRITQVIARAAKAKILVTMASPLFNGNTDQATLRNSPDEPSLFDQESRIEKWNRALQACEEAIAACEEAGINRLYRYPGNPRYTLSNEIIQQLTLQCAFTEKWNEEIIWGDSGQAIHLGLVLSCLTALNPSFATNINYFKNDMAVPLKIAEMFYSKNGVPINEDKTWNYGLRNELRTAGANEKMYIRQGETTANLHFDREPRFYAFIGFDRGIWYGHGQYEDSKTSDLFYAKYRLGELTAGESRATCAAKKYDHFENEQTKVNDYGGPITVWPVMRLSDLYLLYAEALNEAADSETNRALARQYLNRIRDRAGLGTVERCWDDFSSTPDKYKTQADLRNIIRQERTIELAFEGQRFWDIRRWKTAAQEYETPIEGWNWEGIGLLFYRRQFIFKQQFGIKDYFWPIANSERDVNPNLVQNIGW
ncbi:MAG: RagB/SusD family nutrient uptake outer membrane protein [Bacteroidales bacterium]|jgi:hypothetical protein|nr:RagB/SusD family nutrient uptake outer membrane protein [Bacteroidales bacterium]